MFTSLCRNIFQDLCESITLDEMDIESIVKNQGEDGKNREGSDIPGIVTGCEYANEHIKLERFPLVLK